MPTEVRTAATIHTAGYVCGDDDCDCDCMIIETQPQTPTGIWDVTLPVILRRRRRRRRRRSTREPTVACTPSAQELEPAVAYTSSVHEERVAGNVSRVGFTPATVSTWQRRWPNRPVGVAHRIPIPYAINRREASLRLAAEILQAKTLKREALARVAQVVGVTQVTDNTRRT